MNTEKQIARLLLDIEAVTLSPSKPYTWASGLKSPIYCDNRLTISYPEVRQTITKKLVSLIKEHYPEVTAIVGTATAGIPQACWIADDLNLPMAYVRASSKEHGKNNKIEGRLKEGAKVVVVEDLISTGGSSIQACEALKEGKAEVLGVVAIFSYEMKKATDNFKNANIDFKTLSTFSTLIKEAQDLEYIDQKDLESLQLWSKNPQLYSDMHQEENK